MIRLSMILMVFFISACGEIQTHTPDLCDVQSSGSTVFIECNDGTSIVANTLTDSCSVN